MLDGGADMLREQVRFLDEENKYAGFMKMLVMTFDTL